MKNFLLGIILVLGTSLAHAAEPVKDLQQLLDQRQCKPGPVDGLWGSRTESAYGLLAEAVGLTPERPVTEEIVAQLSASDAECMPPSEAVFSVKEMAANAKSNEDSYCRLGSWNVSWLGPERDVATYPAVSIKGRDLSFYKANVDPMIAKLLRLNVSALLTQDVSHLKSRFMDMVEKDHFQSIKPYRPELWQGKKVDWIGWYATNLAYAEPAYYSAIFLIPAAQSYKILRSHLSEKEKDAVKRWGRNLFNASNRAKDKLEDGPDRRSAKAAGFTIWGTVAEDRKIYRRGVTLFRQGVGNIRSDGSERFFVYSKAQYHGVELRYQHMTYGFLSLAAWAMEKNGENAFRYQNRRGATLIDGVNFHLEQSFFPEKRKIQKKQFTQWLDDTRNTNEFSLAFIEYLLDAGLSDEDVPLINKAGEYRDREFPKGFYAGHHGGYTTCLLRG